MAIADIFEALTAADRPYKPPKKVSDALRIMRFMVKDSHIDANLFRLFVASGVYREYAQLHLQPEQVDEVDPGMLLDGIGDESIATPAPVPAPSTEDTVVLSAIPVIAAIRSDEGPQVPLAVPAVPLVEEVDARV
jgi:hypothetical protein